MSARKQFSQKGQVVLTGTDPAPSGDYYAMQVVSEGGAVVASMDWSAGYSATGDWSQLASIPAGTVLTGQFRTLTLTSGEVILHKS